MDYSNISSMLSQLTGQSVYTGKNVSAATEKQAAEILLRNLEPGQIFSGEITDIRGSYVTIVLENMQSVQARLAENFEFVIGQKALFQVKDNQNSQLFIRPLAQEAAQSGELMVAECALTAAGLKMTEKTLELVKNLMNAGQPIDKQNILSYMRQLAKYPQAELGDLITLNKYKLPVNGENVSQMANYRQFENSLLKDMSELKEKLPDIVAELAEKSPERAGELIKDMSRALMPEEAVSENGQRDMEAGMQKADSVQQRSADAAAVEKETLTEKQNLGQMSLEEQDVKAEAQQIKNAGQTKEYNTLLKLSELAKEMPHLSKEGEKTIRELLNKAFDEAFLLKPEEVADKEKVKEYYKGIKEKAESLKDFVQNFGKETTVLQKPVQNMTQNLQFMQNLNEAFTYLQLPLKLSNQEAHGELYVYTKKKAKGNTKEELSAFLHLDMEHLGSVDVLVKLNGQRVGTNFTLETEELLDFIEGHLELLTARLQKKGYDCSTEVMLKNPEEPEQSFEQRLTGETAVSGDIRRFSFDVRA